MSAVSPLNFRGRGLLKDHRLISPHTRVTASVSFSLSVCDMIGDQPGDNTASCFPFGCWLAGWEYVIQLKKNMLKQPTAVNAVVLCCENVIPPKCQIWKENITSLWVLQKQQLTHRKLILTLIYPEGLSWLFNLQFCHHFGCYYTRHKIWPFVQVTSFKYFGLWIDPLLSCKYHIESITNKLSHNLAILKDKDHILQHRACTG